MPRMELETLEDNVDKETMAAIDSKIDELSEGLNEAVQPQSNGDQSKVASDSNGEIPQAAPLERDIKQ